MVVVCVFPINDNINQVCSLAVTTQQRCQIEMRKELKLDTPEAHLEPTHACKMELFYEYS